MRRLDGAALGPHFPLELARIHWAMAVGDPLDLLVTRSPWFSPVLADLVIGGGFEIDEVKGAARSIRIRARRSRTLPDTVGPDLRALICGLNPSVVAADAGYGYAGRSNRFWPAAIQAGLVSRPRDPVHALLNDGVGMTDLVKRASPSADDLTRREYQEGAARVERLVEWLHPRVVVFVGLAGWRAAVDRRAIPGWQPDGFGGAAAYVLPSTSGLNARTSLGELVSHLRTALEGH